MKIHLESLLSQLAKPRQSLSRTRILHGFIIKNHRLSVDPFYATRILRFYALNNDLISARNLFDKTPHRSVFLWNSIVRAYAQARKFSNAFELFKRMLGSETQPDSFTFACIVRACADKPDAEALRVVHGKVVAFGLGLDFICNSALVSCYSKLGLVEEASYAFSGIADPDLVLYNAMVSGYGSCGDWAKGIELLKGMQKKGIEPDGYTLVGLINGLIDNVSIVAGEAIHAFSVKSGLSLNDHVGSMLVVMYSRCKNMEYARKVFDDSRVEPDLISWSSLIAGFSQSGDHLKAFEFFRRFLMSGGRADPVLLTTVLSASAQRAILGPGLEIHGYSVRHECDSDVSVSSALIDMYAKCGFLETGIKVFDEMPVRNLVSYNTVISNLGLFGHADDAFRLFDEVLSEGLKPDEATFAGLLSACCHSGLVNEGRECFRMMVRKFGIEARTEHCVYMVKLLGMDGKLEEAYELVKALPEPVDSGVWGALLSCCDSRKNFELVEVVRKRLLENEAGNLGYSVMMSNLYARDGRWDDVEQLRVDDGGVRGKLPGASYISGGRITLRLTKTWKVQLLIYPSSFNFYTGCVISLLCFLNSPIISFSIYLFIYKYPHVAVGALASSAPILNFDNITSPFSFNNIITQDFRSESENCYGVIRRSWQEIEDTATKRGGLEILRKSFRICKNYISVDSLANLIGTAYTYTAMTDYPTPTNFLNLLPAFPVKEMCKKIDNPTVENNTFEKIYGAINIYYNYSGGVKCFDLLDDSDPHGLSGWTWQACTEMILLTDGSTKDSIFPASNYSYNDRLEYCRSKFNIEPRPSWIPTEFGGHNIHRVLKRFGSNIIFFNGLRDPWSGGGVLKDISKSLVAIVAKEGAHHIDLRFSTDEDPEWLRRIRRREVRIIWKWLSQYYHDLVDSTI